MNIPVVILLKAKGYAIFPSLLNVLIPEQFLVKAAIFFSIVIITVILVILVYIFRKAKLNRQQISFQKKFNDLISEIAICESEEELNEVFLQTEYQKILKQYQQSRVDRNFMIGEMAETCKKFSGTTMTNIHWLFQKTQLKNELLIHLKDKRWYVKARAVQQLAYLQQKDQLPNIFRLANHNDDLVRMEAQIATVKLIGFSGLRFLNVIAYPVSEWQQLRLIQELSVHLIENFDAIDNWLKSKNNSVVEFALRLVGIYQRYEFYDSVVQCLSNSSATSGMQAIITLSKINNETTAGLLINLYPGYDPSIQLLVLKILQTIGAENEIPFLLSQLNHADNSFKLEAAKAIKEISDEGIKKVEELVDISVQPWCIILPQLKTEGII